MSKRWKDPDDEFNSEKFHTNKECIEDGCKQPAGTAWSPYWCWFHNAERMDRIDKSLSEITEHLGTKK